MSIVKKTKSTEKGYGQAILSSDVKNHVDDPFVLEKVVKAKEFLKKAKLPSGDSK